MKFKVLIYFSCVLLFGGLGLALFADPTPSLHVIILTALALIASASPIRLEGVVIHLLLPVLLPAMCILSPGYAGIVGAIGSIEREQIGWPIEFFLLGRVMVGVPAILGSLVYHYLGFSGPYVVVSMTAAYLVYELTNSAMFCLFQFARHGRFSVDEMLPVLKSFKNSSLSFAVGLISAWIYKENPVVMAAFITLFALNRDKFRALLINEKLYPQIIRAMMKVIENADLYTKGHSERVAHYSYLIGKQMGLSPYELERLRLIATLHDLGKQSVPGEILRKQSKLTDEEYAMIKTHCEAGEAILKDISLFGEEQLRAIREHHERFDGKGYPGGKSGKEICLWARIIAVADAFDAMTSDRSYRETWVLGRALAEIGRCAGSQFDPEVADALLKVCSGSDPKKYVYQTGLVPNQG